MPEIKAPKPIPAPHVPMLNPDGTLRREWREYFQSRDRADAAVRTAVEPL